MAQDITLAPDLYATPWRFAWHPATRTALAADFHLGSGAVGGADEEDALQAAWRQIVGRDPARVVLAGDLFETPEPAPGLVGTLVRLLGMLPKECRVIVTPGNHDPLDLGARLGVESVPEMKVGGYLVSHGHVAPEAGAGVRWIVGHQHPAVVLRTPAAAAKMACYVACGKAARPNLILLPAFSRLAGGPLGSNLLARSQWLLPVPRPADEAMRIVGLVERNVGDAQVLDFGALSGLG